MKSLIALILLAFSQVTMAQAEVRHIIKGVIIWSVDEKTKMVRLFDYLDYLDVKVCPLATEAEENRVVREISARSGKFMNSVVLVDAEQKCLKGAVASMHESGTVTLPSMSPGPGWGNRLLYGLSGNWISACGNPESEA